IAYPHCTTNRVADFSMPLIDPRADSVPNPHSCHIPDVPAWSPSGLPIDSVSDVTTVDWTSIDWSKVNYAAPVRAYDLLEDTKGAKRGDLALARLEANYGSLPKTVEAITGSGGRHLIFKHPGFTVSNKQNSKLLGDGIDVRGDGGYIVGPGSWHKSGGVYRW